MPYSVEYIAEGIKAARKKQGLSQRALAAKVKIPQSHISRIEQGVVDLQLSTLIEIARTLELELMLVAREHLLAVEAVQKHFSTTEQIPAYRLSEEDEEEDAFEEP